MRLTDFWDRMDQLLGPAYSRSWAEDQHLSALGGMTVSEALRQGVETRTVWRAVCDHAMVPPHLA